MRTIVTLDDRLVAEAKAITGISGTSALVAEALRRIIQHEASRRIAELGGSMPGYKAPRRGRYFTPDGRWVSTEDAQTEPESEDET